MTSIFTVVLRGYDRKQVDNLLARADAALTSTDDALRASTRELLRKRNFAIVLRGYSRDEVDSAVSDRLGRLGAVPLDEIPHASGPPGFVVALRGYDMAQVDALFASVEGAMRSDNDFRRATARNALRAVNFRVRIRGYARADVDRKVHEAVQRLSS